MPAPATRGPRPPTRLVTAVSLMFGTRSLAQEQHSREACRSHDSDDLYILDSAVSPNHKTQLLALLASENTSPQHICIELIGWIICDDSQVFCRCKGAGKEIVTHSR